MYSIKLYHHNYFEKRLSQYFGSEWTQNVYFNEVILDVLPNDPIY